MNYLKTKTVEIKSLGINLEIKQLHAKAQSEVIDAYNDPKGQKWLAGALTAKYGVPAWAERTVDDLATSFTMQQLGEIANAISDLSDADVKNSASTPNGSSSSS